MPKFWGFLSEHLFAHPYTASHTSEMLKKLLIYSRKNFLNSSPPKFCEIVSDWVTGMLRPLFTMLISVLILIGSLYSLNVSAQHTESAAESKASTLTKAMNYTHILPKLLTKAEVHKNRRETSGPNLVP